MSERKVLNKYYPPDYDPSLIPRLKRAKDRQYVIRVMAPFNMRCKTCGNYIYKGTKFNARMETVQDKNYLGLRIYRFYIKCTRCVAEITFMTDPENQDYSLEHGATRNFEAEKLLEQQEKKLQAKKEEDEANPMKMLEIRTRDSKREMEMVEALEELRELNERHVAIDYEGMLRERQESEEERQAREKKEEDLEIRAIFNSDTIRRLQENSDDEETEKKTPSTESRKRTHPTDVLSNLEDSASSSSSSKQTRTKKIDVKSKMTASLLGVVRKKPKKSSNETEKSCSSSEKPSSSTHQTTNCTSINQTPSDTPACSSSIKADSNATRNTQSTSNSVNKVGGLSLLGGYGSGSSSDDSD